MPSRRPTRRQNPNPPLPLRRRGSLEQKICSVRSLARVVRRAHSQGQRIVLTNGCFDLLHVGHIKLLERAKGLGDVLIVAINSDRSVKALKGSGRPIVPQQDRARLLAALASVDYVTVFDEPTPAHLITTLEPDVLVKGADWRPAEIVGRDIVSRRGGQVVRVPLVDGYSTARLLARIARLARWHKP